MQDQCLQPHADDQIILQSKEHGLEDDRMIIKRLVLYQSRLKPFVYNDIIFLTVFVNEVFSSYPFIVIREYSPVHYFISIVIGSDQTSDPLSSFNLNVNAILSAPFLATSDSS